MKKGAAHIDFAMALSVMVVVIAFSMFYITNYFSNVSPNFKTSELRASAAGIEKILFGSAGIPANWENNNYAPVRAGLRTDLKKIAITAAEKGGVSHGFEEADLHVVFDRNCLNTTYNSSIRVYDRFMNETPFKIYNYTECAANSGFLREANINFLFNITGNASQIFWLYYTNNTATPQKSAYNFSYDPSLVGYWKFDSVNASNYTLDSTAYKNDGKLYNGSVSCFNLTGCINLTAGQINSGLVFDGVDDYVNVSGLSSAGVSVAYWKKNSTDMVWHHIANISGTLYVNGAAGAGQKVYVTNASENVVIGKDSAGNFFNGTIDDMRIYNRSLSADEIKALYNYTRPNYIVSSGTVPAAADKKISALQNLSYNDAKASLDLKGNFNITACEYSFGKHVPDTVNVMASAYPIILINSSGAVKPCLAGVNVW